MAVVTETLASSVQVTGSKARYLIITPGEGSSAVYTREILEQAVADKVFPAGTQSHANHDTETDTAERPEGDIRNLVGSLTTDAYWDETLGGLVAEVKIGTAWREFISDHHDVIGTSISAKAELNPDGSLARLVPDPFNRVDLVTVAGRGGKIVELLEHSKPTMNKVVKETSVPNPARKPQQETTMEESGMVEISQKEYDQLTEAAGRAETLAEQVATLEKQQAETARVQRVAEANRIIEKHYGNTPPELFVTLAETLAASDEFDATKFETQVEEAAKQQAAEAGTPDQGNTTATANEAGPRVIETKDITQALVTGA